MKSLTPSSSRPDWPLRTEPSSRAGQDWVSARDWGYTAGDNPGTAADAVNPVKKAKRKCRLVTKLEDSGFWHSVSERSAAPHNKLHKRPQLSTPAPLRGSPAEDVLYPCRTRSIPTYRPQVPREKLGAASKALSSNPVSPRSAKFSIREPSSPESYTRRHGQVFDEHITSMALNNQSGLHGAELRAGLSQMVPEVCISASSSSPSATGNLKVQTAWEDEYHREHRVLVDLRNTVERYRKVIKELTKVVPATGDTPSGQDDLAILEKRVRRLIAERSEALTQSQRQQKIAEHNERMMNVFEQRSRRAEREVQRLLLALEEKEGGGCVAEDLSWSLVMPSSLGPSTPVLVPASRRPSRPELRCQMDFCPRAVRESPAVTATPTAAIDDLMGLSFPPVNVDATQNLIQLSPRIPFGQAIEKAC